MFEPLVHDNFVVGRWCFALCHRVMVSKCFSAMEKSTTIVFNQSTCGDPRAGQGIDPRKTKSCLVDSSS
ncbi:unnamed protein product [Camellia sinensis]